MKRGPLFAIVGSCATVTWLSLYLQLFLPLSPQWEQVVSALPCLLLMWFGCVSLASISIGLLSVEDCPKAAASLQSEVACAKEDLRKRGLKI
ncbi:hypothetical protein AB1Y20_016336 [Prymnesium parvum]|uniref:Dolichol-phosphate mannosyltransferase subunit 3 n=1 Tax=Prymnesium parvum TaxID=97485 RepID=A0AB34ICG6_PRYPA